MTDTRSSTSIKVGDPFTFDAPQATLIYLAKCRVLRYYKYNPSPYTNEWRGQFAKDHRFSEHVADGVFIKVPVPDPHDTEPIMLPSGVYSPG